MAAKINFPSFHCEECKTEMILLSLNPAEAHSLLTHTKCPICELEVWIQWSNVRTWGKCIPRFGDKIVEITEGIKYVQGEKPDETTH